MVAVGASAGGLDALETLFGLMPADTGLAFVVLQHLDRRHPSVLADILGQRTRMPVVPAADGLRLEAGRVHVITPNTTLTVEQDVLRVGPLLDDSPRRTIDVLLQSLARDRGEELIGVLLSGAGSDGTAGLRAVKEHGGVAIAQDPRSASHASMPRTAIEAGLVDEVLEVERMPAAIVEHARHLAGARSGASASLDEELRARLPEVCAALLQRTGNDFGGYKQGTLLRRIRRRLQLCRVSSAAAYLEVLERDPAEAQRLLRDLLIGVTEFFRDQEVFSVVAGHVLPAMFASTPPDAPARIWVAGCASGEEAYSIGILVKEHLTRERHDRSVQIFATDVDAAMIAEARAGHYPREIQQQVAPHLLERYFVREGPGWRVASELRDLCIFSVHNLVRDPPFPGIDLVSCRNVLIYFEPDLQQRVVPLFHYALRRGGHLVLGPAEGLPGHGDLFDAVDKKHRIFRRRETPSRRVPEFPLSPRSPPRPAEPLRPAVDAREHALAAMERLLLDGYAPASAMVDERGEIRFLAGPIGRYLSPRAGAPASNLLDAVDGALRLELRLALSAAAAGGARVIRDGIALELEDGARRVRLTVRPVPGSEGLFAVVIQEPRDRPAGEEEPAPGEVALVAPAVEQLEAELRTARADLRVAVESTEAANEELRSANEELISTNEELQSANEELQTSKEELQSLNEELETINTELHRKVVELATANADLRNLFAATEIATIFLDRDLRVTRFTPAATALVRLLESDLGRPIADLAPRFEGEDLAALAREVLRGGAALERHVRALDRPSHFILRLLPYRTADERVAGVVATFIDVSDLLRAEAALRESEQRYSAIHDHAPFAIALLRIADARYVEVNAAWERAFGFSRAEVVGWTALEIGIVTDLEQRATMYREVGAGHALQEFEAVYRVRSGERRTFVGAVNPISIGGQDFLLAAVHDVTERRRAEDQLLRSRTGLARLADASLRVVRETELSGMLQAIAEAALALTGGRLAVCGHGDVASRSMVGGSARAPGMPACPPGDMFLVQRGGVHLDLVDGAEAIRLTDAQLRSHPRWWGGPPGHVPMRGLLGARMVGRSGRTSGLILVTDKAEGDFGEEEESLLRQLATIASLALQHVETRVALEEADRSKDHFLAMLSHELRNPLAPISNSLSLLERAELPDEGARRARHVIGRQVQLLTHLVDDLLDLTRISRGKIQLRPEPLDLRDVVRRSLDDHLWAFQQAGIAAHLSLPEVALPVVGDRTRLAQVVGNLLHNAAKFTDSGGRVQVGLALAEEMEEAVLRVQDDGVGIAPDMLPRVFEPFAQADTTLERSKGGLGLGLALVKGLSELHGGTVTVASDGPGRGAEFVVRLPIGTAAPAPAPRPRRAVRPRRILVVDDNVDAAESLRDLLRARGHAVEPVFTGTAAVARARAFAPDVILCDIGLPGMDGYAVARTLRADPALRAVRLVALSGYATVEDVARAMAAGFDLHLAKPAGIVEVEDALDAVDGAAPGASG